MRFRLNTAYRPAAKRAERQIKNLYQNKGVLKDAIIFELAEKKKSQPSRNLFSKLFQLSLTPVIYLALVIPYFLIYFIFFGDLYGIFSKFGHIISDALKSDSEPERSTAESENTLAYNT